MIVRLAGAVFLALLPILGMATPAYAQDPVTLELRANLDETTLIKNGVPTLVTVGIEKGFSLPIWNAGGNQFEQLFFNMHTPHRWDGESDISCHICVSLDTANTGKNFQIQLDWEYFTPGVDVVPVTSNTLTVETPTGAAAQYQTYCISFTIDYDIDAPVQLESSDEMVLRVRRVAATADEITGEVIIHHLGLIYQRGDLLREGGVGVTLIALVLLATGLTVAMFVTRERMLGFPCVIMWAILGAFAYGESATPWGDWQYYLFFGSAFGMTSFCALAAFGLREKRDSIADEELEKGDGTYIDEAGGGKEPDLLSEEPEPKLSKRTLALRKRAEERRTKL